MFLATTGLQSFWDTSQDILFLGDWCLPQQKSKQEKWRGTVLSAPLMNHDFEKSLCYIDQVYHILLPIISNRLNQIHHEHHSVSYWEILIGSFLFLHIQTVYDRYERLKVAFTQFPELTTIGLAKSSFLSPFDTNEYIWLIQQSDAWNLQLFTQLISMKFKPPIAYQAHTWETEIKNRENMISPIHHYKLLTKIKLYFLWFIIKLRGAKTIALCQQGFSKKNLLRLMWLSGFRILPIAPRQLMEKEKIAQLKNLINLSLRNQLSGLIVTDPFAKLVLDTLKFNMPMVFIENYQQECLRSKKEYPYFSKVIVGTGLGGERLKLWGARFRERGTIRVGMQHGGPYGPGKNASYEFLEHKCSDYYIDWGYKTNKKVIAAPEISICEKNFSKDKRIYNGSNNTDILWVVTEFLKYPSSELRHALGSGYLEPLYYDWQCQILALLPEDIFKNIVMRLRYSNFSERWKLVQEKFPTLKFYKSDDRATFFEQIWSAKLLLFDNLNTTYLHGFAMNIPSILFFDERIWPIRDEIRHYFDRLSDVGIYHNSPESAADMIKRISSNPMTWWEQKEVQEARKQFCDCFLAASPDWLKRWNRILLGICDGFIDQE